MLNKLTEEEITQIIVQLDKSNLLKESKTGDSALVAFDSQKDVITDLNTIYLEWQQQQIFRELSDRFKKLSEIQRKNMYCAVQTAQAHNQIIPTNPSEEFKIDVRIQELLNADINLEFFGGIGGDNLVVGLGGLHGAIHVFTLYLGQFFEAVGQFTENLLLLPFEVNGVEVGDDVLLTVKGYQSAVAGFGFLQQVGLIQLHDDLGDLLFCELIEHAQ